MGCQRPVPYCDVDVLAFVSALPAWRAKAACLDEDPELFFPVGATGPALDQIAQAKTVCERCPVVSECLDWALETNQDAGVWGGKSEDERRATRRARKRRAARSRT